MNNVAQNWSKEFGLALTPLFESERVEEAGAHNILLDGGLGTFVLSDSPECLWENSIPAAWAWSSDIPHHVTVTADKIGVVRWDRPGEARVFSRNSVERSLKKFYEYLTEDRLRSNRTVVEHLLGLFRRIRSLNLMATDDDSQSTNAFTAVLASLISPSARSHPQSFGLSQDAFKIYDRLNSDAVNAAIREVQFAGGSLENIKLYPSLAIRHASGQLFQEAHFELLRAPSSLDLFNLVDAPEVNSASRGGTHFTPPALARSIVEQTLNSVSDLPDLKSLTISDPACGSGAFLHEALRTLRARNFQGQLHILGKDISSSAIAMAKFVLHTSLRDWTPKGGVKIKLEVGDSLDKGGFPTADIILMNPPFLAFGAQSPKQREQLKSILGSEEAARGDISMAFILKALNALSPGGTLGTLFPAGLLSSKSAASWREKLCTSGRIRLLASIGDFGLFAHALVRVASLVVQKPKEGLSKTADLTALITENDQRVTGEALRYLRKHGENSISIAKEENGWTLFPVSPESLKEKPVWNLIPPAQERALGRLKQSLPAVRDLFTVGQGIQTGYRAALLLTDDQWHQLPSKERKYFRAAIMSDSIQAGEIVSNYWLFFPHTPKGPRFASEQAVKTAVPMFFKKYLAPNRDALTKRASIVRSGRTDWWGLMHPRKWSYEKNPRIVSKFFAGEGGFACDSDAHYLPVTGHIWFPEPILTEIGDDGYTLEELLRAYTLIFNSPQFVKLLSLHSPYVAGGQFDLSWRHVASIPIPNLRQASTEIELSSVVDDLIKLAQIKRAPNGSEKSKLERLVKQLYGKDIANIF